MPLRQHDPGLMIDHTHRMHPIGFFLFKLQSASLGFPINRDRPYASLLLLVGKALHKELAESCFYLIGTQTAKETIQRALVWRDAFLETQCFFDFIALGSSPLGDCQL